MKTQANLNTTKEVKSINHILSGSKNGLTINLQAVLDGEEVLNKRGDSFVGNFGLWLYKALGKGQVLPDKFFSLSSDLTSSTKAITSITSQPTGEHTGKLRVTCATGLSSDDTHVICSGLSVYTSLNGVETPCVYVSSTVIIIPSVSYISTDTGTLIRLGLRSSGRPTSSFSLYVGRGDRAVSIDDGFLSLNDTSLTASATSYGQETNVYPSYSRLSRVFTNNTAAPITVKEIGVVGNSGGSNPTLYAREVLSSPITILAGSNLTINYDIGVNLVGGTDPGGFTFKFSQVLATLFSHTMRGVGDMLTNTVRNLYSAAVDYSGIEYHASFRCWGAAGGQFINDTVYRDRCDGEYAGVIVGRGDTAVAITDYALGDKIMHGGGSGQLLHYGTLSGAYVVGANYRQFTLSRLFENATAGVITVMETGLGASTIFLDSQWFDYPVLFARNVLTVPVDVAPGEILKVTYTIRVEV